MANLKLDRQSLGSPPIPITEVDTDEEISVSVRPGQEPELLEYVNQEPESISVSIEEHHEPPVRITSLSVTYGRKQGLPNYCSVEASATVWARINSDDKAQIGDIHKALYTMVKNGVVNQIAAATKQQADLNMDFPDSDLLSGRIDPDIQDVEEAPY